MTGWTRADDYLPFLRKRLEEDRLEADVHPYSDTTHGAMEKLWAAQRALGVELLVGLLRVPGVRVLAEDKLKRMAARYRRHPAYSHWWTP